MTERSSDDNGGGDGDGTTDTRLSNFGLQSPVRDLRRTRLKSFTKELDKDDNEIKAGKTLTGVYSNNSNRNAWLAG